MDEVEKQCSDNDIKILPLKSGHIDETFKVQLPDSHKDAFDRLIMAISVYEGMTLASTDKRMRETEYKEYGVNVIW